MTTCIECDSLPCRFQYQFLIECTLPDSLFARPLRGRRCGLNVGEAKLDDDHELRPVQQAWTYLSNASDKLDYPRYRREGLPCTSSLIESQIKEFNARLKGTEKFWNEEHAEAMLELVNWTLREDGPTLSTYFDTRTTSPFRRPITNTLAA